jgi:5-formyltetrahydrofolate cyclo-ligase
MKEIRKNISLERRKSAEESLESFVFEKLNSNLTILSFYSFQSEISLHKVNATLSSQSRLYLPKIIHNELKVFKVSQLSIDVEKNCFGIFEPIPKNCSEIPLTSIDCIFVPGLAFDEEQSRLGYGKGFYDKLLASFKGTSIGLGFKEQSLKNIPSEPHDQKLSKVVLF